MKYNNINGIELGQFNEIMGELGYDGDEVYYREYFDHVFSLEGWEAIEAAFYGGRFGYPQDSFNPNDEYFSFNGYGNLMSIPEYCLQDYFNQYEFEILEYVNDNEVELYGVEEEEE